MDCAVTITLFNGAPWIRQTLDAVKAQTLQPAEVVVVDDGSTDGSPEMVSAYDDVVLLRNPDKGLVSARNWGFKHTSSPFIAFLDHDDPWHPDHLKGLHGALMEREKTPAAVSLFKVFKDLSQRIVEGLYPSVVQCFYLLYISFCNNILLIVKGDNPLLKIPVRPVIIAPGKEVVVWIRRREREMC